MDAYLLKNVVYTSQQYSYVVVVIATTAIMMQFGYLYTDT